MIFTTQPYNSAPRHLLQRNEVLHLCKTVYIISHRDFVCEICKTENNQASQGVVYLVGQCQSYKCHILYVPIHTTLIKWCNHRDGTWMQGWGTWGRAQHGGCSVGEGIPLQTSFRAWSDDSEFRNASVSVSRSWYCAGVEDVSVEENIGEGFLEPHYTVPETYCAFFFLSKQNAKRYD